MDLLKGFAWKFHCASVSPLVEATRVALVESRYFSARSRSAWDSVCALAVAQASVINIVARMGPNILFICRVSFRELCERLIIAYKIVDRRTSYVVLIETRTDRRLDI